MRQRASTDLCGGRSAMVVPTAPLAVLVARRLTVSDVSRIPLGQRRRLAGSMDRYRYLGITLFTKVDSCRPVTVCGLAFPSGRLGGAGISWLSSRRAATYSDADWSDTVTSSACSEEAITQIRLVRK
jgi:hypothetical protein